ncbi:2-octaprenyl-6-methoxyphenyl hydroxylase [Pseudidiomarina taiwanensis]|uniref:2-octaprenyl-6-methoxyphenyl hydroxylase n=1 Tax=Pseudidiomarina taiwanensis TaxID=337250 RepID=A0A432ZCJ7_9GAMM|nr:2-octaprenyl-6-methoxyphenyl hydroxylase [Pseudidiomarina taiwanensis]RUO75697.1 2-octaprenyl-6-methoxyphenyl hydroxylase [Pseudidiomarina taiwanensis]
MDTEQSQVTPVVIAGGGLVGALTALLLARVRPDWTVTVLEPREQGPAQDKRTIALAAGTVAILNKLGVWSALAEQACRIRHIHVSDRGYLGMTRLHAQQQGVEALGEVIAAAALNQELYQACIAQPNIDWRGGYRCLEVERGQDFNVLHCDTPSGATTLSCRLVLAADGQRSQLREQLGIRVQQTDYQQHGIIAILDLADDLDGWAYERFTETGPIALLPMPNRQASLVWTLTPEQAAEVEALSDDSFVRAAQGAFGYRAGRFTGVRLRVHYPLQLQLAEQHTAQRAALIGNASHTLHPIAGQGFNLGVRDALAIAAVLAEADDPGSYRVLSDYWQAREADYQRTIGLTDLLVRGFSNHYWPLNLLRNIGLSTLEAVTPLRDAFAEQTMGLGARAPQLKEPQ